MLGNITNGIFVPSNSQTRFRKKSMFQALTKTMNPNPGSGSGDQHVAGPHHSVGTDQPSNNSSVEASNWKVLQDSRSQRPGRRRRVKRLELIEMFITDNLDDTKENFDTKFKRLLKAVPSDCPAPSYDEFFIYFFLGSILTIPDTLIGKIGIKSLYFSLHFTDKRDKIAKLVFEIEKKGDKNRQLLLRTVICNNSKGVSSESYYSDDNIQEIIGKLNPADRASYNVDARIFHLILGKDARKIETLRDEKTEQTLTQALQMIPENDSSTDYSAEFTRVDLQSEKDSLILDEALEKLSQEVATVEEGVKELLSKLIEVCETNERHFPRVAGRSDTDHRCYKESRFHGFIYGALVLNFNSKYHLNCYVERASGRGGGADLTLISRKDNYKNRNLDAVPVIIELKADQSASRDGLPEVKRNVFSNVRTFSNYAIISCASYWSTEGKEKEISKNNFAVLQTKDKLVSRICEISVPQGLLKLISENYNEPDHLKFSNLIEEELERLHHSIPSMEKISGSPNYLSRLILGEFLTIHNGWKKFAFVYNDKKISESVTSFLLQQNGDIIILNIIELELKDEKIKKNKKKSNKNEEEQEQNFESKFEFIRTIPIIDDRINVERTNRICQIDIGINPTQTKRFSYEESTKKKYLQRLEIKIMDFDTYQEKEKHFGNHAEVKCINYLNSDEMGDLKIVTDGKLLETLGELNALIAPDVRKKSIANNNLVAVIHGLFIGGKNIFQRSDKVFKILAKTSIAYKKDLDLAVIIGDKIRSTSNEIQAIVTCTSKPDELTRLGLTSLTQKLRATVQLVNFNKDESISIENIHIPIDHQSICEADTKIDFMDAIQDGNTRELKDLLDHPTSRKEIRDNKDLYEQGLELAIKCENIQILHLLWQNAVINEDQRTVLLRNILRFVVEKGDLYSIGYFLEQGAVINDLDGDFLYSLRRQDNWNETVKFLISKRIDDKIIRNCFALAVEYEEIDTLKWLLENAINQDQKTNVLNDYYGNDRLTPIHVAVETGDVDLVEYFIQQGADVNYLGESFLYSLTRRTDLHWEEMVKFLISKGVHPDAIMSSKGRTLLHKCMLEENDLTEFLIEKGADVKFTDRKGRTPLDYAAYRTDYNTDSDIEEMLSEESSSENSNDDEESENEAEAETEDNDDSEDWFARLYIDGRETPAGTISSNSSLSDKNDDLDFSPSSISDDGSE